MKPARETSHVKDASTAATLRRLEWARTAIGWGVMAAMLVVVWRGVVAFAEERDAWLAMRWPLVVVAGLIWGFARCARAIVARRGRKRP